MPVQEKSGGAATLDEVQAQELRAAQEKAAKALKIENAKGLEGKYEWSEYLPKRATMEFKFAPQSEDHGPYKLDIQGKLEEGDFTCGVTGAGQLRIELRPKNSIEERKYVTLSVMTNEDKIILMILVGIAPPCLPLYARRLEDAKR